jgi:hypothetical protein
MRDFQSRNPRSESNDMLNSVGRQISNGKIIIL